MNSILSEKDYQRFIIEWLEQENDYVVRKAANSPFCRTSRHKY